MTTAFLTKEVQRLIAEVTQLSGGGTYAIHLANHALKRGYPVRLYSYNMQVFDPTWFRSGVDIRQKLRDQMGVKTNERLQFVSREYLRFLDMGGQLRYEELNPKMLARLLDDA